MPLERTVTTIPTARKQITEALLLRPEKQTQIGSQPGMLECIKIRNDS